MTNKLGVVLVGAGGAVASTVVAGSLLMKKRLAPAIGMITETDYCKGLPLAKLDDLEFAGWDIRSTDLYTAAKGHGVIQRHMLDEVKEELSQIKPWACTTSSQSLAGDHGDNLLRFKTYREELSAMKDQLNNFKKERGIDRLSIVNLASTERYLEISDVHVTPEAFEKGLDANDPKISPAMKYLYLAITMGIPYSNFTPSLTNIPALATLAERHGVPMAGEDGKTGQTLLKTVLAPAFRIRDLKVEGWYSTNILGNNDGRVLDDPGSNKTKVMSKRSVLDDILGYHVESHQVHIHYYKPRGDAKEAWDNIDLQGFLGEPMQLKLNFLCKDSILAAPVAIDLARLMDFAHRAGESGVQRQFSLFFKAPYRTERGPVVNDLFAQTDMFREWTTKVSAKLNK